MLMAMMVALMPVAAQEPVWNAHAAAALLDASFESSAACEAQLAQAREAEATPSADIDPRLRDMFTHARCLAVGDGYAMRLEWAEEES